MHNKRKHNRSSSQFKGVCYNRKTRKWYARCRCQGHGHGLPLGPFDTEVEAARAYDRQAVEFFGEFARLNFPREWPPERRAQVYTPNQQQREEASKIKGESEKTKAKMKKVESNGGKPRRTRRTRRDEKTREV